MTGMGDRMGVEMAIARGRSGVRPAAEPIELAVVLPTFCEAENVERVVARLHEVLGDRTAWEAIFVDDNSPDGTADRVREIARSDRHVRVIERIGRRGLSSATIEGMLAASAPYVAVMDADLQHDAALLPQMLEHMRGGELDLVIGSRFVDGGGLGDWERERADKSALATRLSRFVLKADVADPMSGFFMVRTDLFRSLAPRLSGIGFKILLDIFTASREPLRFAELPYEFHRREAGESKLDHVVALEFLLAMYDQTLGRFVPTRFAMFGAIGGAGIVVHMTLLAIAFQWMDFIPAQALATLGAMTFNFFLNNALTYRDRRLHGARALAWGWFSFCLVCGVGALANVGVAGFLYEVQDAYWTLSALAGIVVGAVWNYALSSKFTWGRY